MFLKTIVTFYVCNSKISLGWSKFGYNSSRSLFTFQLSNNSLPRGASMKKGEFYDGDQDGNHPPYPGVIIEEMIDSASQVGSPPDENKCMTKLDDRHEVSA